jgi:hypothetical protein
LRQFDALEAAVAARAAGARDELATREIIAIRPSPDTKLTADQLDDAKSDARLIGIDEKTGTVLLDVPNARLDYLRVKVDAFADDAQTWQTVSKKDGSVTLHRGSERAVAPVGQVGLATLEDVGGPRLHHELPSEGRRYWYEVACRGGYRVPAEETAASRAQIARQLQRIGAAQQLDAFDGSERVYFFVHATPAQLDALRASTDCIYEVELAPEPIRDLKLFDELTTSDLKDFALTAPSAVAPAVVLLDTGIATGHPLLKEAILSATTGGPEIPSPEDTYGHGTKVAGLALHHDIGAVIERGHGTAEHWLQSSRVLVRPGAGTASDESYEKWPVLTRGAVIAAEAADPKPRDRVFALAVTRTMQDPPLDGFVPTLWSHAIDQLAFNDGRGRLIVVAAGNAREEQWLALAEQHPQLQLSEKIHQPAQSANALTVGAFTDRTQLPPSPEYADARVVATMKGGISPFTSTGLVGTEWPIKPDVVLEGGNLAIAGALPDAGVPTLSALTTHRQHPLGRPLGQLSMTSEATARAARLAARIWNIEPGLRPESVRALIVHSASWTPTMLRQFEGLNDRLVACGWGVPDERLACECARDIATVVIEDAMPNAVAEEEPKKVKPKRAQTKTTEPKDRRKVKVFRLPVPADVPPGGDHDVELRVTLSYFPEPNRFGRTLVHGLDLKWDMQGPAELEEAFIQRINVLARPVGPDGKRVKPISTTKSFDWTIGINARSRGTVQSDRCKGKLSQLAGGKLIAVVPVLGWWNQRTKLRHEEMKFSLIVSLFAPGAYASIKPLLVLPVEVPIEV